MKTKSERYKELLKQWYKENPHIWIPRTRIPMKKKVEKHGPR